MAKKRITRRDFLKRSAGAAVAGAFCLSAASPRDSAGDGKSRVILVRNKDLFDADRKLRPEIVQEMLDQAVTVLMAEPDPVSAWKRLVKPSDTVGIKTNVWSNLPTTPEVENALRRRVLDAGVPENRVAVRDRGVVHDPFFIGATALINARPMRTHSWSGVGTCLKNYIMFVERPPDYHPDSCADLAAIWKLPIVKDKTRLNVLVMFTPLFHSTGPHDFNPQYVWPYGGLIVGIDPVAVDSTGVRVIEAKRREYFGEERPIDPPPKHVFLADTRHHVGTADPRKIDLRKIGWTEGSLI